MKLSTDQVSAISSRLTTVIQNMLINAESKSVAIPGLGKFSKKEDGDGVTLCFLGSEVFRLQLYRNQAPKRTLNYEKIDGFFRDLFPNIEIKKLMGAYVRHIVTVMRKEKQFTLSGVGSIQTYVFGARRTIRFIADFNCRQITQIKNNIGHSELTVSAGHDVFVCAKNKPFPHFLIRGKFSTIVDRNEISQTLTLPLTETNGRYVISNNIMPFVVESNHCQIFEEYVTNEEVQK